MDFTSTEFLKLAIDKAVQTLRYYNGILCPEIKERNDSLSKFEKELADRLKRHSEALVMFLLNAKRFES